MGSTTANPMQNSKKPGMAEKPYSIATYPRTRAMHSPTVRATPQKGIFRSVVGLSI